MSNSRLTFFAMLGAGLMLAHQVSGKAVRDSFFLTNYPASDLPKAVIAAAALSVILVLLFARLIGRYGPSLIVPAGFLASSLLHLAEYFFFENSPRGWALVIYFHIIALSSVLLSGFWSVMTEAFDPRAAKQTFGQITAVGTLGGITGGILVERVAVVFPTPSVLLLLVVFHLSCSIVLVSLRSASPRIAPPKPEDPVSPVATFRRAPYLLMIALVVLAGTSSAAILDYLFKAGAGAFLGTGTQLLRFFAIFYTSTQIITFAAQTFLVPKALQQMGIGRTISVLPFAVGAGSLCSLLVPVFPAFALIRSLEFVLRGSLYRSGYELLFTPVPPREKRAAKTLIDVAFDRAGDALGSAIVQLFLWVGASYLTSGLLGVALVLAAAGVWISLRLDRSYSELIEQRLVDRAVELDLAEVKDSTTRSAMVRLPSGVTIPERRSTMPPRAVDATLNTIRELRSGDAKRTLAALKGIEKPAPVVAAQLLRLLAWDEVSEPVQKVLQRDPDNITGLLIDHLVNQNVQFGIRRRVPRILRNCNSLLAVQGLVAGLSDERFEVRFQCSRALDALVMRKPELKVPAGPVFAAVQRELRVARPIWNSRRLIDKRSETDPNSFLDEVLRERANKSLEHVFSLFATVLPRDPVKIAFRVLHTEDRALRGLAAEYLDSVLPTNIRELLWAVVEPGTINRPAGQEAAQEALEKLLKSHESLMIMFDKKPAG